MARQREHLRTNIESRCLMDCSGKYFKVELKNLSLGGALVKLTGEYNELVVGEVCDLMLCNDPAMCPTKYSGRVVRIESHNEVGLQFNH